MSVGKVSVGKIPWHPFDFPLFELPLFKSPMQGYSFSTSQVSYLKLRGG